MGSPPRPLESQTAWSGRYLSVEVERWSEGDDRYEVVRKHDAVGVVPITPSRDVLLVRQFRVPVRDTLLEIPAGLLDVEDEDALTCAGRELHEETGYRHTSLTFMGGCYLSPGFTDEYLHLFLAETDEEPEGEPEDEIELVRMPLASAVGAAREGRIRNVSTALGLLMAAARMPPT